MELKDILAISGQPGLYKYVAQSMRGVIVESLLDGKRMNASATSRVSALTEISMFTEGEDIALADVFTKTTYVGFTATPFANVFINPVTGDMEKEDLALEKRYCLVI